MDDTPIVGTSDEGILFKDFQATYGAPAYIRRARGVELAWQDLCDRCRRQRDDWMAMVRLRLGTLYALAGSRDALRPLLADDEQLRHLEEMHQALSPQLRCPIEPVTSWRKLRAALLELRESIELFNRRWSSWLPTVDLTHVNDLREGYNRYYVLEKECSVRNSRIARAGFQKLSPVTTAMLLQELPLLPLPVLRD